MQGGRRNPAAGAGERNEAEMEGEDPSSLRRQYRLFIVSPPMRLFRSVVAAEVRAGPGPAEWFVVSPVLRSHGVRIAVRGTQRSAHPFQGRNGRQRSGAG